MSAAAGGRRDLRVHVVIDHLVAGGAELLLGDLAAAAPGAGLQLSVSALYGHDGAAPAAGPLRAAGVEPAWIGAGHLYDPRSVLTVRRRLAATAPDVVHTHLLHADILGSLGARSLRLPAVSTLHVSSWDPAARERARLALAGRVRRACTHRVVAVSAAARDAFLAQGWDEPERVVTIHNGVAARVQPGAGAAVRAELGLSPDDEVVTMLAGLRPVKGHDVALDAVASMRERRPGLRLVIAGEGPLRGELEQRAAALGDGVVLAGLRSDAMALLDASDVLLYPSRVESLPTALIEALAAGTPIVATDTGGIPEIVEDRVSGLLLPSPPTSEAVSGALDALLDDSARRRALADAGRRRYVEMFSADLWVERLRALYLEAIAAQKEAAMT